MTLPEAPSARKPSRLGLYIPFALLLVGLIVWSGFWVYLRGQAVAALDNGAARLREGGYQVSWRDRTVGGYPFRLNVTLTEPRVVTPSGWTLAAPMLDSEAFVHAPGLWLLAAPRGFTFTRPRGGPVNVTGQVIRASVSHFESTPPNISVEGVKLVFAPAPGAQPFALAAADRFELHLRATGGDTASSILRIADATPRPGSLWAAIGRGRTIDFGWEAGLAKVGAFKGANWADAVRAWTLAGGVAQIKQVGITAGEAQLIAKSGALSVDADGRLRGDLEAEIKQAPRALAALGQSGVVAPEAALIAGAVATAREEDSVVRAKLTFQAGQTTLGPVALAPAPKVF